MQPNQLATKGNISVIEYHEQLLKLTLGDIDGDINLDEITKINLNNLVGEIITSSVLINRWGNILAECQKEFNVKKMDFEIWCAKTKEEIRKELTSTTGDKVKKPTIDEVDTSLLLNENYRKHKLDLIQSEKAVDIVNGVFWSLKDKSNKLDKLSLTIQKEDLNDFKSSVIHGIKVSSTKKKFEDDEDEEEVKLPKKTSNRKVVEEE